MLNTLRHHFTKHLPLVALVVVMLLSFGSTVLAQSGTGVANQSIGDGIQSILWTLVNVFFGWIVFAGGQLLNIGVNDFVIGFGDFYIGKGLGAQIDSLWIVVRDIFNLTFIFGLVGIGLRMIFNSNDSSTRKMLISLIMAALLVNFSLFITKFVVDFSNIATVQLVNAFPKQEVNGVLIEKPDISGHFMQLMGLKGIFNMGGEFSPAAYTAGAGLGYIFGTMILYIVAGFVFFAGGILLLIRFAVLNIYMVLSPLMFIGWVFPSAAGITSQYWKGFLGRAFFAPAYILMLYFAQKIVSTFSAGGTSASLGELFKPGAVTKFEEVVPPFILTAIFLIASIVVAQKMGANGASGFVSMGQNLASRGRKMVTSAAGSATFGVSARAAQSTLGYGARQLSNNASIQKFAASNKIGKAALKTTTAVADSSFDARRAFGIGKSLGLGDGNKGGYDSRVKERSEADAKFAKLLKETEVYKTDANGKKVFASKEIEEKFEKNRDDLLAKNTDYQAKVAATATKQAEKEAVDAAVTAKKAQKATIDSEIAQLKNDLINDKFNITKQEALADKEKQVSTITSDIASLTTQATTAEKALSQAKAAQEKIYNGLISSVESSIKYQNQLAFIETKQRSANQLNTSLVQYGAGGAGLAAGVAAVGPLGIVGALAMQGVDSIQYSTQESVNNLRKIYGKDGSAMDKSKKQKESATSIIEQLKELDATPKPEKPDAAA